MNSSAVEHLILEGSAAADFRRGGRFCFSFFCGLSENAVVKELLKLDNVWPSYCQKFATLWLTVYTVPSLNSLNLICINGRVSLKFRKKFSPAPGNASCVRSVQLQ